MNTPSRLKLSLAFLVICILWGASWAAVKIGLDTIPIFLSISLRFFIASIILGGLHFILRIHIPKDKIFWRLVTILSLTSFTLPFILVYWSQKQINSGLASILFATFPFWVAILSHYLLKTERITLTRLLGMLVGFVGIIIIFNDALLNVSFKSILGMHGIILSAIFQAYGLIYLRKHGGSYNTITLNFWPMIISSVLLGTISLTFEDVSNVRFNMPSILSIAFLSIFSTVITFIIYIWLIKHVEAVLISFTAFITPIIAILIAVILMNEIFTSLLVVGSTLVLFGVAIALLGDIYTINKSSSNVLSHVK